MRLKHRSINSVTYLSDCMARKLPDVNYTWLINYECRHPKWPSKWNQTFILIVTRISNNNNGRGQQFRRCYSPCIPPVIHSSMQGPQWHAKANSLCYRFLCTLYICAHLLLQYEWFPRLYQTDYSQHMNMFQICCPWSQVGVICSN